MSERRIERIDSIPLIFHGLQRMNVSKRIDLIWRPHSNWEGLSYGELAVLFLTYVVYMRTHRLCSMEEWVERHRTTLEAVTGWPIGAKEGTDDRLGRLLEVLGRNDDTMYLFQRDLGTQLIQAYSLPTEVARFDTSTFSGHHAPGAEGEEPGLMQLGHSQDRRPDLRQFKQGLGSLDPAGIPLFTQTVSGETADDGLYWPAWREMRQTIGRPDFLFVADCKAAALATRAALAQEGGAYLFPLPMTGTVPDLLRSWVLNPPSPLEAICLDKLGVGDPKKGVVGQGFVVERTMEIARKEGEEPYTWTERWLVTQSNAQAHRKQQALERRLSRAEQALDKLTPQKKESVQDVQTRVHKILTQYKVEELIQVDLTETTTQRKRFIGRGRPGPHRPFQRVTEHQIHLPYHRLETAIEEQRRLAGWRIHVTNTVSERLSLPQAIAYYRDEWLIERGFHRFKKGSLPALPLWLRLPERIKGLMLLLMVALQLLTLMEFVVARELADRKESCSGLVPGNPKRKTTRPSADRILALFTYIHLLVEETEYQTTARCVESLSPLQQQMLDWLDLPQSIYDLTCHRTREKIKIPA
jgi:transposase